jgi:hypothetical protein
MMPNQALHPDALTRAGERRRSPNSKRSPQMKQTTLIIIGVLAAIVGVISSKSLFKRDEVAARSPLDAIASTLNAKVPMQVDQNTRWDSTAALPNNVLAYYYTITGVDAAKIDKAALKAHLTPIVTSSYKTTPDMQGLRDLKANLKYIYRSDGGVHLFDIDVPFSSISP